MSNLCEVTYTQNNIILKIKYFKAYFFNPLPVSLLHGVIGHHLQQRTGFVEVIDLRLEVIEGGVVLECLGQFADLVLKVQYLGIDFLNVHL